MKMEKGLTIESATKIIKVLQVVANSSNDVTGYISVTIKATGAVYGDYCDPVKFKKIAKGFKKV